MAIVYLMGKKKNSSDNTKTASSIFIDLKMAVDTIDNTIRLQKLNYYGSRGIAGQSVSSYL